MSRKSDLQNIRICLIVEGYEEKAYFEKLKELAVFNDKYEIVIINAKGERNIPAYFQAKYSTNLYHLILVVCDADKDPKIFYDVIKQIESVIGPKKSKYVVYYTRPCILQIILSHFDDVKLETQAKRMNQDIVVKLTGVKNYSAKENQLQQICAQIKRSNFTKMEERVLAIGSNFDDIPSSNLVQLFKNLESDDIKWVNELSKKINN